MVRKDARHLVLDFKNAKVTSYLHQGETNPHLNEMTSWKGKPTPPTPRTRTGLSLTDSSPALCLGHQFIQTLDNQVFLRSGQNVWTANLAGAKTLGKHPADCRPVFAQPLRDALDVNT